MSSVTAPPDVSTSHPRSVTRPRFAANNRAVACSHPARWHTSGVAARALPSACNGRPAHSAAGQGRVAGTADARPGMLPAPDAIVVAPATFNTINKWAAGISDTLALGLLTEAIGKRLPIVALPFINAAQAEHPAFQASVDRLRAAGMQLLYGPDVLELHEPGTGSQRVGLFPWRLTLEALDANQAGRPFRRLDREAR